MTLLTEIEILDGVDDTTNPNKNIPSTNLPSTFGNPVAASMQKGHQNAGFMLYYPDNLSAVGEEPFTLIDVYESVYYRGQTPTLLGQIGLPVPAQLVNNHSLQYEETSMFIEATVSHIREWAGKNIDKITGSDIADAIQAFISTDYMERVRKKVRNPHMASIFKGVNFRKFNFSFSMMAKSVSESYSIKKIIRKLQYHCHPEISDSNERFFLYPENFRLSVYSGVGHEVFKTGLCVLQTMNINYNGQGIPVFFESTKEPVNIVIDLGFSEIEIVTKNFLRGEYGSEFSGDI